MSFRPNQIPIGFFVDDANELLELFLGLLITRGVGSLRRRLCTPGSVGETKLNPTRLGRIQFAFIDFRIELMGASVRALRLLRFGVLIQLGVVRLLRYGIEQQEGEDRDGRDYCFHGGNGTVKSGETCEKEEDFFTQRRKVAKKSRKGNQSAQNNLCDFAPLRENLLIA